MEGIDEYRQKIGRNIKGWDWVVENEDKGAVHLIVIEL